MTSIYDVREEDEPPLCPCGKGYLGHKEHKGDKWDGERMEREFERMSEEWARINATSEDDESS